MLGSPNLTGDTGQIMTRSCNGRNRRCRRGSTLKSSRLATPDVFIRTLRPFFFFFTTTQVRLVRFYTIFKTTSRQYCRACCCLRSETNDREEKKNQKRVPRGATITVVYINQTISDLFYNIEPRTVLFPTIILALTLSPAHTRHPTPIRRRPDHE